MQFPPSLTGNSLNLTSAEAAINSEHELRLHIACWNYYPILSVYYILTDVVQTSLHVGQVLSADVLYKTRILPFIIRLKVLIV